MDTIQTPGPLVEKLFGPIRKRYLNRPGGYTRVLRIESPKEDQADAAILELVDGPKDLRFRLTAKTVARQRELMTEAGDQPESMEYATETSSVDEDMPTQTMEPNSKRKAKKAAASAIPTSNPAVSIPQQTMRGLNQLTSMNIKKVTQFRRGGVAEFEQLVTQFQNFHQTLKPRSASLLPSSSSSSSSSSPFSASTKITTKDSITRIADPKIERRLIKEVEVNKGQARVYPVQERGSRGFKGENRERRTQRMKKGEEKAERGRREEEMDRKEENAWKRVRLAAGL